MMKHVYNLIVVLLMGVAVLSCQKQDFGNTTDDTKSINVSLNIGFSEEADGYELAQTTRGELDENAAFDFELVPTPKTRANTNVPDKLYNLEICQYDANGNYLNGTRFKKDDPKSIGGELTISLSPATDCQLVIVAWGNNVDDSKTLGTGNLLSAMDATYSSDLIKQITPDATDMSGMPYVLHLKNVNVKDGAIQSGTGEVDARIRLKRVAALLTLNWSYNVSGYNLKQILLQSIPMDFRVIPNPDSEGNYPSLINQFTTVQLTADEIANGSYSRWIPANVRGDRVEANSITNRYKATAPQGSVFANFIAVNSSDPKKKLDYRVYVGGTSVTNFDVRPNTNYTYQVNFSHNGIPLNDKRVTYIDPIPASTNNNNFVPTANCFMVAPGGSFNFTPTKIRLNGVDVDNKYLTGSDGATKWGDIAYAKLLWQTKEDGDVGDPVIGIANSADDHTNIVEYKGGRIYCRVAANTSGGSGVIAAYDSNHEVLWSWHVWVTDYAPSATAKETVLTPNNKRIQKYGTTTNLFMDRNLGAVKGFVAAPAPGLEMSKGNGFHYQRARKDPFPGSYTTKNLLGTPSGNSVYVYVFNIQSNRPPEHMLNRYGADGLTWIIPSSGRYLLRDAYRNPTSFALNNYGNDWGAQEEPISLRGDWGDPKSIHDPCPAGWRVPSESEVNPVVTKNITVDEGFRLINYDGINSTFFRFTGYPPNITQLNGVGQNGYLMTHTRSKVLIVGNNGVEISHRDAYDAHTLRCIQEK